MIDNPATLSAKLEIVRRDCGIAPGLADRFSEAILAADDWSLFRINPLHFAAQYGFPPTEMVDLFVAAARAGLVDLSWDIVCPTCGAILGSTELVGPASETPVVCVACEARVPVDIDEVTEVTFRVNPGVHTPRVDPFADWKNYRRAHFSESVRQSGEVVAANRDLFVSYQALAAGESVTVSLELPPDSRHRIVDLSGHTARTLRAGSHTDPAPRDVHLAFGGGDTGPEIAVDAGPVQLFIANHSGSRAGVLLERADPDRISHVRASHPPVVSPFLTGKALLNNRLFRELFRIEQLSGNLSFNVRSLTILFTDLKGSTELYEHVGDIRAYQLVRRHFQILWRAVQREGGVVIKTMGDAVMATFCDPEAGLAAALDMLDAVSGLEQDGSVLGGLKIGIHEGPALAINNDGRLDYFGHTVNMASRIQGLAKAGEIWMSASVHDSPRARSLLAERGIAVESLEVALKGIGGRTPVYRCSPCSGTRPKDGT